MGSIDESPDGFFRRGGGVAPPRLNSHHRGFRHRHWGISNPISSNRSRHELNVGTIGSQCLRCHRGCARDLRAASGQDDLIQCFPRHPLRNVRELRAGTRARSLEHELGLRARPHQLGGKQRLAGHAEEQPAVGELELRRIRSHDSRANRVALGPHERQRLPDGAP
ncbi:MAG: hypothetical protein DMD64_14500 [Gemmatimonadetes bacterium]|nr:MAG: hypothetical protein DMD64_14500 [Gemmatimonadota bacterium]